MWHLWTKKQMKCFFFLNWEKVHLIKAKLMLQKSPLSCPVFTHLNSSLPLPTQIYKALSFNKMLSLKLSTFISSECPWQSLSLLRQLFFCRFQCSLSTTTWLCLGESWIPQSSFWQRLSPLLALFLPEGLLLTLFWGQADWVSSTPVPAPQNDQQRMAGCTCRSRRHRPCSQWLPPELCPPSPSQLKRETEICLVQAICGNRCLLLSFLLTRCCSCILGEIQFVVQ